MKICTCNNCGNIYEDQNPSNESIEYPELPLEPLTWMVESPENAFWACPECEDDGYLMDNINENTINDISKKTVELILKD